MTVRQQKKDNARRNRVAEYETFDHIEDLELRTHNRVQVIKNMMVDGRDKNGNISLGAASLVATYFQKVPAAEREGVIKQLTKELLNDS